MELLNRIIHALTELHPLHPMLVHFPIALSGAGLFFILLARWKRSQALEQAAFANLSLAAVSAVPAALTGMRDNALYYQGTAPNAGLKIALASAFILVTGLTALVRWRRPALFEGRSGRVVYLAAYALAFALALTLSFLGGVILYGF
jgi:uncharacterized membrane protein